MEGYKAFAATVRGYSHEVKGIVCQDSSFCYEGVNYALATVCDGHGGEKYFRSDRGSRFAAEEFDQCVFNFISDAHAWHLVDALANSGGQGYSAVLKEFDTAFDQLVRNFIFRWRERVCEDFKSHPFEDDEMKRVDDASKRAYLDGKHIHSAYGTTFLGVCMTHGVCFGFQIGDGDLFGTDASGAFFRLVEDDPKIKGNMTTSLCGDSAFSDARKFVRIHADSGFPVAVFASTDGVMNSFLEESNLHDFYRQILLEMTQGGDISKELASVLPGLSKDGSRDDVSVAGVVNVGFLKSGTWTFKQAAVAADESNGSRLNG